MTLSDRQRELLTRVCLARYDVDVTRGYIHATDLRTAAVKRFHLATAAALQNAGLIRFATDDSVTTLKATPEGIALFSDLYDPGYVILDS
jgi:hypothetical protein